MWWRIVFIIFAALCVSSEARSAEKVESVLVIYPYEPEPTLLNSFDQTLRSALVSNPTTAVRFYTEYLDLMRFPDENHQRQLAEYLRVKYADRKIDLIISMGIALEFLQNYGEQVFSGTPIVFTSLANQRLKNYILRPNMTGLAMKVDYRGTLDLILALQPDTRGVVLVSGTSAGDRFWISEAQKEFQDYQGKLTFSLSTELSMSDLLDRMRNLPAHTVVFYDQMLRDATGHYLLPSESLVLICQSSSVPVYSIWKSYVGLGIVGGYVWDYAAEGAAVGKLGLRILAGEKPQDVPVRTLDTNHFVVDQMQLRRWGISERKLPPGSIVQNKKPFNQTISFWALFLGSFALLGWTLVRLTAIPQKDVNELISIGPSPRKQTYRFSRSATGLLLGGICLAFLTLVCYQLNLNLPTIVLLYLIVVVLVSLKSSFVSSAVVSLIAVLCMAYFFVPPIFPLGVSDPLNFVALIAFLTIAMVITRLMSHTRKLLQAQQALHEVRAELAHVARVTTVGEMTASIAHEVNQPLAAVVTNAGACLRWISGRSPDMEEARQALGRIIKEGNRASEVIARIRALVKKSPPRKDWLDINETILEVASLTGSEVDMNHISVKTQLSHGLPLILGDRIQLQQVILNLIKNAVEAMSAVSEGPRELLVSSGKDESKRVLVAVRDSGPGLDPETLAHLFDTFYTTKPDGMGMGLAISRSIIEDHGGRLWATPNDPHGAVFQFTLPADGDRMP